MADIGLGIQTVTQTATITSSSIVDVDIPANTIVVSSGIQITSSELGSGSAFMSADGPHPTDATKWRFQASVANQSGGNSYTVDILCWMIVANAATC
jgi:hypothetical protein